MIRYLLLAGAFLLIIGRFRRPLLSAWRFVVPLTAGGIIGWYVIGSGRFQGAPGWMLGVCMLFCTFLIGGVLRDVLDDFLPPKR